VEEITAALSHLEHVAVLHLAIAKYEAKLKACEVGCTVLCVVPWFRSGSTIISTSVLGSDGRCTRCAAKSDEGWLLSAAAVSQIDDRNCDYDALNGAIIRV